MSKPIRLMIVDDHAIVRHGLRSILELEPGIMVAGEAGDAATALALIAQEHPDVVLLDLSLGAQGVDGGLELCQTICADHPRTSVIVLTTFLDDQLVLRAIRSGARGYVLKDVDAFDLIKSVRAVHRGESALDTRTASLVMKSLSNPGEPQETLLTEREHQVLRLLACGLSNREIGEQIAISESTVKFHLRNIMRKLNVHHRAEVVYVAGKLGLL